MILSTHAPQVYAADGAVMLFCKCKEATLLNLGISQKGQIYLNCPSKDPHRGWKGGCGMFAWMYEYMQKQCFLKTPIIVTVHPSFWQRFDGVQSQPSMTFPMASKPSNIDTTASTSKSPNYEVNFAKGSKITIENIHSELKAVSELIQQWLSDPKTSNNANHLQSRLRLTRRILIGIQADVPCPTVENLTYLSSQMTL
ncbi:hypothetical protein O181_015629 [Austropuccinia psidii MF-1]|uniref:Uncharacterized protein n=1 Tax=Austropuccinia psidii MF-1 TaxID=1389203 RepID=A0A9Q3GR09_9BASI|nr:hypothetical protein [Austropuccinia psidii MF-1]